MLRGKNTVQKKCLSQVHGNPSHETQNSLWIKTRGKISGSTPASSRDLLISKIEKVTLKTRKAACYIASSVTDIYIYTHICDVLVLKFGGPTILIDVDPLPSF